MADICYTHKQTMVEKEREIDNLLDVHNMLEWKTTNACNQSREYAHFASTTSIRAIFAIYATTIDTITHQLFNNCFATKTATTNERNMCVSH